MAEIYRPRTAPAGGASWQRPERGSPKPGTLPLSRHLLRALGATALLCAAAARCDGQVTPASIAGLSADASAGRGATLPFVEYEAEAARTNGQLIGPDRTFSSLAAEASGRKLVKLVGAGRYVEFTLARSANAVTVRYAIPDSADGKGLDATLGVRVGSERLGTLKLTSRYGWFYGANPFTNRPADGKAHHFFDEARIRFSRTLPAGTTVRLEVEPTDTAPWYGIDLADFELVPAAITRPANSLSVLDFGADPTGARNSLAAFKATVSAGRQQGRTVWIPTGEFRLDGHLDVDRITIAGAGPWYSVLRGNGVGIYGGYAPNPSTAVTLRDFAIIGEVTERNDQAPLSGVGGAMGGGSNLTNLWIQHEKTGVWFDGPMSGVTISGLRILDLTADGINFHRGVSRAVVQNTFVRNTGDDALAMWSHHDADHDNAFRRNTIVLPLLANGIGIYGGYNIEVSRNLVADIVTQGGGIHVGNRFDSSPVAGVILLANNSLVRAGSYDPNWQMGVGAFWLYALDAPMSARIVVQNDAVIDASQQVLLLKGKQITGLTVTGLRVDGAKTGLLQVQSPGAATMTAVVARGLGTSGIMQCRTDFRLTDGGGNQSWLSLPSKRLCGS